MAAALTAAQVLELPASVPIVDAGRALGLSRSATFDAYHAGSFPLPVIKAGRRRLVVPRAALLRLLAIDEPTERTA